MMNYIAKIKNTRTGLPKIIDLTKKSDIFIRRLKWFYKNHSFMTIEFFEVEK